VSDQQRPDDVPHTQPTPEQPPAEHAAPTGSEHAATTPQPTGWPPAAWSGSPYGPRSDGPHAGTPHAAPAYGGTYGPAYGSAPLAGAAPAYAPVAPPRRSGRWRLGVAGLVAGALIGGGAGAGTAVLLTDDGTVPAAPAAGQQVVINDPETATTATAAAAKAAPSVVTVYVSGSSGSGSGSGVVLTEDGYVLTNNHVVAESGGGAVQVRTADGTLYDAEVVGTDPSADVAVVKLDGASGLTPAAFADSDEVQVGDVAVAIGAPLGLSNTVTDGIVSATNRAVNLGSSGDANTVIDAIQTDAAINPGNSGGALVDGAGEVIGVNTAIATVAGGLPGGSDQSGNIGVGFAIPSNTAKRIATEIIEDGEAERAFLGVSATTESENGSAVGSGARVVSVEPGSPAADAGLEAGDVVTAIGNRPVTSSTELTAAVRSRTPGDDVSLTVQGDGGSRTVEVTLGSTS
jgi:putative serine protease PepD